jgi:hypothetical protein
MQTLSPVTHYTPTQTAGMIRKALKAAFPKVKFEVVTSKYAGGSSISIRYAEGPTVQEVADVADAFEGRGFDGMIDMAYSIQAWMLNGQVIGTASKGTVNSRGSVPAWGQIPPHDDAELVSFGGSYIRISQTVEGVA